MTKKLPPHAANMASTSESALAWEVDAHRSGDTGAGARVLCRCAAGRALGGSRRLVAARVWIGVRE
jgi:hypothetical protein